MLRSTSMVSLQCVERGRDLDSDGDERVMQALRVQPESWAKATVLSCL